MSNSNPSPNPITSSPLPSSTTFTDAVKHQQKDYDCLPCRVMGSTAFVGLGIYTYASGMNQLRKQQQKILTSGSKFGLAARKAAIFGTSAVLAGLGMYRLVN